MSLPAELLLLACEAVHHASALLIVHLWLLDSTKKLLPSAGENITSFVVDRLRKEASLSSVQEHTASEVAALSSSNLIIFNLFIMVGFLLLFSCKNWLILYLAGDGWAVLSEAGFPGGFSLP
jgi:hypothetical protein